MSGIRVLSMSSLFCGLWETHTKWRRRRCRTDESCVKVVEVYTQLILYFLPLRFFVVVVMNDT